MGSQTLEILRQGVWASLTGGWFYDPHQDIFCNTVHLYLWLYLLCTPFAVYLYFPATLVTWGTYCVTTTLTIAVLKVINMHLHKLYDRAQAMSESNLKNPFKDSKEIEGEDECGIEMQVLGNDMTSKASVDPTLHPISDANSLVSAENVNSTIDLKVDVHRKNSSESCESISYFPSTVVSMDSQPEKLEFQEQSVGEQVVVDRHPLERKNDAFKRNRRLRTRIERQCSLDSAPCHADTSIEMPDGAMCAPSKPPRVGTKLKSRLQRHRSSETHVERRVGRGAYPTPNELVEIKNDIRRDLQTWVLGSSDMYLEESYTKSDLGIEQIENGRGGGGSQRTPMRKDSSSTMSALQLPVGFSVTRASGSGSGEGKKRRHSSASKPESNVRRIKSAALETPCGHPSTSFLPTHPNSIEAISGGQAQQLALPPLVRNPHLNLCPKFGSFGSGFGANDPVYPIVELADEKSLSDVYVLDDTKAESDSEGDRPMAHSTDSETDNNGSRSPLLTKLRSSAKLPNRELAKIEAETSTSKGDSGCPSSDCEHASASSKDMLLSAKTTETDVDAQSKDADELDNKEKPGSSNPEKHTKSTGAIPKTTKRKDPPSEPATFSKAISRTSSSASSRSFSVESDIYRAQQREVWIMYGAGTPVASTSTASRPFPFYSEIVTNYRMPQKRRASTKTEGEPASTTLSIQGLMNEQQQYSFEHADHYRRTSSSNGILTVPPLLNVSGQHVELSDAVYCDYWRPAASLSAEKPAPAKRFYKYRVNFCGTRHEFRIEMDRLQLLALFDRDLNWCHVVLAVALSSAVCLLGAVVLQMAVYKDIYAFLFCLVIAGSQYSLVKSVQPDAASPIHGFNKTVAYSRPIYFCLCSALLVGFNNAMEAYASHAGPGVPIFGAALVPGVFFGSLTELMAIVLLAFPVLFSLGLFPQINTFSMYFLEQVDMHVFGGNATSSLLGAFLCVLRSLLAVSVLYGPAYGGLYDAKGTQHISFSVFCALLVPISYHLSRSASDFSHIWQLVKTALVSTYSEEEEQPRAPSKPDDSLENIVEADNELSTNTVASGTTSTEPPTVAATVATNELPDPLPKKLQSTVNARLKNDLVVSTLLALIVLGLHCSTVFTVLQPDINAVLYAIAVVVGLLLHYVLPQLRKHMPWLCFAKPILRQREFGQFEVADAACIMWFEKVIVYLGFFERNVLYPLIFVSALTADSQGIVRKFGLGWGTAIVVVCGLKCVRNSYSDSANQFLILVFSVLFFKCDFAFASESFLVDYFFLSLAYRKFCDFLLKLQFIVTYIAPWQITWGSAFHAFAQPFSVPHSAMLFLQAAISSLLSTPLNPFLGSAIFLTSYVRPIKFWERDYNTRRIDHSNTRLSSQLERDLGADDNNLNSIFYEHLTRSLQHSLCGDLLLGRWGNVNQGDCFVLASDYLNCLVHIIELGNGLCTFQMRGLEFRGTYCQQREVEAISEGVEENDGCCCCSPGHLPQMLSVNAMFSTRWLAWQVVAAQYVLEGYSISENLATATLQVFEFRKVLITYYIKTIIYYVTRNAKLDKWLVSEPIQEALATTLSRQFADLDPIFNYNLDEDFDCRAVGITRSSFCAVYLTWIQFCYAKRKEDEDKCDSANEADKKTPAKKTATPTDGQKPEPTKEEKTEITKDSPLVSLCLALGLLARRTLATATHSSLSGVEFFLHGLHALFKGDFRITSPRDEWVFADMELLHGVVAPAVKMALKLHQDHFSSPDEYLDPVVLYDAIAANSQDLVISHEADPVWRSAVLRGAPNLLALRHVLEDGSDEYRIIRLTKRFLSFRVIKLNRECVRGLWSGQQQELIYLRNRNPERGSIQNAKQALRNIINSSCDQPIGYPIYVSPLTTSYADTNQQLCRIVGGAITLESIRGLILNCWRRVRERCREGCSSGSSADIVPPELPSVYFSPAPLNSSVGATVSYGSQSLSGTGTRGSLASMNKPTSSTLLAGLLNRERDQERELMRESRGARKLVGGQRSSSDRERRATLPATSSTGASSAGASKDSIGQIYLQQMEAEIKKCAIVHPHRISKCNTADSLTNAEVRAMYDGLNCTKSLECEMAAGWNLEGIDLNAMVVIVSEAEIIDDQSRQNDLTWPSERMRSKGTRLAWQDWTPKAGMVGHIVHCWLPSYRSPKQEIVYLLEIGEHYVPVGEKGVKECKERAGEADKCDPTVFTDIPLDKSSSCGEEEDESEAKSVVKELDEEEEDRTSGSMEFIIE